MGVGMVNRPVAWPGTEVERAANEATHHWMAWDPEEMPRCTRCDCNAWGTVKDWPCGVEPPRETVPWGTS